MSDKYLKFTGSKSICWYNRFDKELLYCPCGSNTAGEHSRWCPAYKEGENILGMPETYMKNGEICIRDSKNDKD